MANNQHQNGHDDDTLNLAQSTARQANVPVVYGDKIPVAHTDEGVVVTGDGLAKLRLEDDQLSETWRIIKRVLGVRSKAA
ncbi:MAG: hypothetical protein ACR2QK_00050 [Acidimicrobiales bacterium]